MERNWQQFEVDVIKTKFEGGSYDEYLLEFRGKMSGVVVDLKNSFTQ